MLGLGLIAAIAFAPFAGAAPEAAPPAEDAKKPDAAPPAEAPADTMTIIYLGREYEEPLPLSYAEKLVTDKGIQGARLMLMEANQAGGFVGHNFDMVEAILPEDGDVVA
ncbi:MAG: hypothetical protein R6X03_04050, partial [Methyloceanibacter sp.]